ncbi:MAG: thioredoxin-like domain-containing protein [Planctomycetota bacterium]|nr:thioredoxin-like domain-containing protein [Planctomycetota bacterium]
MTKPFRVPMTHVSTVFSIGRRAGRFGVLLALFLNCFGPGMVQAQEKIEAPELEGGVAWLNTAKPITLKSLRGKIVLLDFWTLCCINCIHTLPDLAKLEKKYARELVVIGVHSPKFENEKETASIRKALLRYEVKHPVVNDANQRIWRTYGASGWPSLVLIDPEGNVVAARSGEGNYDLFDRMIGQLVKIHKEKKTLDTKEFKPELDKEASPEPLRFPGKVIADPASGRIFIADSTNHRIVITDMKGKVLDVAGGNGPGATDGPFSAATFNDPQGLALFGNQLIVADRKNHSIRSLDLKTKKVTRIAGTGIQGQDRDGRGKALAVPLNSPWDVLVQGKALFIALAGHHQIWKMDLEQETIAPFAGNGRETLKDGPLSRSSFAQPSALTTDGVTIWIADSETSSIRSIPLDGNGEVKTLVGLDLFEFGDIDGIGDQVRLQHALGVTYLDGVLYVADTYNSKLKTLDPKTRSSKGFLDGFHEPGGISAASNGKLYVADTNNHQIWIVDPKTKEKEKLVIQGLGLPKP